MRLTGALQVSRGSALEIGRAPSSRPKASFGPKCWGAIRLQLASALGCRFEALTGGPNRVGFALDQGTECARSSAG